MTLLQRAFRTPGRATRPRNRRRPANVHWPTTTSNSPSASTRAAIRTRPGGSIGRTKRAASTSVEARRRPGRRRAPARPASARLPDRFRLQQARPDRTSREVARRAPRKRSRGRTRRRSCGGSVSRCRHRVEQQRRPAVGQQRLDARAVEDGRPGRRRGGRARRAAQQRGHVEVGRSPPAVRAGSGPEVQPSGSTSDQPSSTTSTCPVTESSRPEQSATHARATPRRSSTGLGTRCRRRVDRRVAERGARALGVEQPGPQRVHAHALRAQAHGQVAAERLQHGLRGARQVVARVADLGAVARHADDVAREGAELLLRRLHQVDDGPGRVGERQVERVASSGRTGRARSSRRPRCSRWPAAARVRAATASARGWRRGSLTSLSTTCGRRQRERGEGVGQHLARGHAAPAVGEHDRGPGARELDADRPSQAAGAAR